MTGKIVSCEKKSFDGKDYYKLGIISEDGVLLICNFKDKVVIGQTAVFGIRADKDNRPKVYVKEVK